MQGNGTEISRQILAQLANGLTRAEVETELMNKGHDQYLVNNLMQECIKLRAAQKRTRGLALILLGALICLTSCVATLLSFNGSFNSFTLIGLTSIGIVIVFAGLMMVF